MGNADQSACRDDHREEDSGGGEDVRLEADSAVGGGMGGDLRKGSMVSLK